MSKARDEYRKFIVDHAWEWEDEPVLNYVVELEAEKAELIKDLEYIAEQYDDQFIQDILQKHTGE